ncbi:protein SDA1 homolog [Drosophila miranda]|uniref:protein SDA1 homolog n=1 Tax=Drosophila miranda TaxID=7229 RepID=UPI00143F7271|nr:protein SDA1 homolog [Drosophila miranda]
MKKKNAPAFNFSGIHLVHNPQGMAEGLFKQLQATNERFEVKLTHLDRQVTRVLQFAAQASHELVPGDIIEPILKTIANNFITERNSSDVMAIGLNATREICMRCPLAMGEDLLQDLAMYKTYKEKSVMMAARSLITRYREQLPALLHKKDRGRQTEAQAERKVRAYGEREVDDTVLGAEALLKDSKTIDIESDEDSDSNDGQWKKEKKDLKILNQKEAAQELALTRIFTDEDFKRINAANLKKTVTNSRKRPLEQDRAEFVKLNSIEMIFKKRKHDKESRMETVQAGRQDRERFGWKDGRVNEHCSKTNSENRKTKNFGMMRHKARSKVKKSFRDKQLSLRKHLLHQKKMK